MKRSKFTEQIAFASQQAQVGITFEKVCTKMGISDATLYNWKKKYGSLGPSEVRQLKRPEEENAQFKKLVADLSLIINPCCRTCSQESVKAFPQAVLDRCAAGAVQSEPDTDLRLVVDVTLQKIEAWRAYCNEAPPHGD